MVSSLPCYVNATFLSKKATSERSSVDKLFQKFSSSMGSVYFKVFHPNTIYYKVLLISKEWSYKWFNFKRDVRKDTQPLPTNNNPLHQGSKRHFRLCTGSRVL